MPSSDTLCSHQSCCKNITKSQGSVSCVICTKWFHANCVGINTEQLTIIAKAKGCINFICDLCKDSRHNMSSLRDELTRGLADIQLKFDSFLSQFKLEFQSKISELTRDIENCNKLMKATEESMNDKICFLEHRNEVMQRRLNRADILINGLPKYQGDIDNIVMRMGKELNVNIESYDVNCCHYMNNGNTILVKFNNVVKRDLVMRNYLKSKKLCLSSLINTDIMKRIYLNDHLTPKAGRFLYRCRKLVKDKKITKYRFINADKPKVCITLNDDSTKTFNLNEFCLFFGIDLASFN